MLEQNISNHLCCDEVMQLSYFHITRQMTTHPLFKTLPAELTVRCIRIPGATHLFDRRDLQLFKGRIGYSRPHMGYRR